MKKNISKFIVGNPLIRRLSVTLTDLIVKENMGNHYPIVAMPKSSSTFISLVLARYFDLDYVQQYCPGYSSEDDYDYERIIHARHNENQKTVGQYHMRATKRNIAYIQKNNQKVVLVTRNLLDVVISLHDHLMKHTPSSSDPYTFAFMTKVNSEKFRSLPEGDRYDFLIDHYIPWYLNFYSGWFVELKKNKFLQENLLHVCYEEHNKNSLDTFNSILSFYNQDVDEEKLNRIIQNLMGEKTRLNKGVCGRGRAILSDSQVKKVEKLIDDIDFQFSIDKQYLI